MGMPEGANSPSASPPKRSPRSRALSVCVSIAYPLAVDLARARLRQLVQDEDLLRHHVRRPVPYEVLADLLDGGLVGAPVLERRLLVAPVTHRHRRAPVNQLADLVGRTLPTLAVYDQDLGIRDGLADAP